MSPTAAAKPIDEHPKTVSGRPALVQHDPMCSYHASINVASNEDPMHIDGASDSRHEWFLWNRKKHETQPNLTKIPP